MMISKHTKLSKGREEDRVFVGEAEKRELLRSQEVIENVANKDRDGQSCKVGD